VGKVGGFTWGTFPGHADTRARRNTFLKVLNLKKVFSLGISKGEVFQKEFFRAKAKKN